MAIYRLLQNSAFAPEDLGRFVAAYEGCLRILNLSDRSDPITDLIAKKVIEVAQTGIGSNWPIGTRGDRHGGWQRSQLTSKCSANSCCRRGLRSLDYRRGWFGGERPVIFPTKNSCPFFFPPPFP